MKQLMFGFMTWNCENHLVRPTWPSGLKRLPCIAAAEVKLGSVWGSDGAHLCLTHSMEIAALHPSGTLILQKSW